MGWAIAKGEMLMRRPGESAAGELISGAALAAALVLSSYFLTRMTISRAYRRSHLLGSVTEIALGWTSLAARSLEDEASLVLAALEAGDVSRARRRLARIVGRDTHGLDALEISRAVIETLAESASDGVVAPLFYMTLGGVPLAMAYKAVNTLDSMIGHADARYFYFGKAAARLDDAANFVPARLTALAIVLAPGWSKAAPSQAWRVWRRDGGRHKSPNAGQPESAVAGAIGVRLGGGNFYEGEFIPAPPIGKEFPPPEPRHVRQAIRMVSAVAWVALGAGMLVSSILRLRRRRS